MRALVLKSSRQGRHHRGPGAAVSLLRSGLARLALVAALGLTLFAESACVADVAYEIRMEQAARKHVYSASREKLLAAAEKAAVAEGWSVEATSGGFVGRERERGGRKEKLTVTIVEEGGGRRLEAELDVEGPGPDGKPQTSKARAGKLTIAVLSELEPKVADEAKKKAREEAKEDAKLVRACGRRAVDLATEGAD